MVTVNDLRKVAIDDGFTDEEVYQTFVNTTVNDENDLYDIVSIMESFRPGIVRKLETTPKGDMI